MRARLLCVFAVVLTAAIPVLAHHSWGVEYDSEKCMDLRGTLTGLKWENPHAYIDVEAKNADGKTVTWHLEMVTPNALKRNGTTREDFEVNFGKTINVRMCQSKIAGESRGAASYLQLADGEIRGVGPVERRAPEERGFPAQ